MYLLVFGKMGRPKQSLFLAQESSVGKAQNEEEEQRFQACDNDVTKEIGSCTVGAARPGLPFLRRLAEYCMPAYHPMLGGGAVPP